MKKKKYLLFGLISGGKSCSTSPEKEGDVKKSILSKSKL